MTITTSPTVGVDPSQWRGAARCTGSLDTLFGETREQRSARAVCRDCPVRMNCLAEALDGRVEYGVWGGMTERERRSLLRRRPDVVSWRSVLVEGQ